MACKKSKLGNSPPYFVKYDQFRILSGNHNIMYSSKSTHILWKPILHAFMHTTHTHSTAHTQSSWICQNYSIDVVFFLGQLLDLMEKKRTDDYRAFTDALETHYPHLFLSLTGPIDEIETGMCNNNNIKLMSNSQLIFSPDLKQRFLFFTIFFFFLQNLIRSELII